MSEEIQAVAKKAKNKGGRPKGARTTKVNAEVALRSPEVQALMAEAVAIATADLTARLAANRAQHGTDDQPGDQAMMRQLAMAIAEVSDPGNQRKRVAPEIMESRRE